MPKTKFQRNIIEWYGRHKRDLPWRKTGDPYKIWLSEIILQQTRVEQGLPYYEKFVANYPSIRDLADADEDRVLKDWEGLGYYSRARNLHHTSKEVAYGAKGVFPDKHPDILKLKGVGDYTAAAISSFAFNKAHAVVDGNVFRVLARYLNISTPINTPAGKKEFAVRADEMLHREDPATYNQAIMEFGALQCVPKNPDCSVCPLKHSCAAQRLGKVENLPVKEKKTYNRERYFNYAFIRYGEDVYVEQRMQRDIWNKLYQFALYETSAPLEADGLMEQIALEGPGHALLKDVTVLPKHKLSHQGIFIKIFEIELATKELPRSLEGQWVRRKNLGEYAFPRPLRAFLDRKQLTLPL